MTFDDKPRPLRIAARIDQATFDRLQRLREELASSWGKPSLSEAVAFVLEKGIAAIDAVTLAAQPRREGAWTRIGRVDKPGRRSLWLRMEKPRSEGVPAWLELCAGREGDDNLVRIENDGSHQFHDLWDTLGTAEWIAEAEEEER